MPLLGAGTWLYDDDTAYESACKSFAAGITMVDTALGYGNQRGVGRAIKDCWHGERKDLFVMTKIPGGLNAIEALAAHHQNLHELNLTYVDHLMVHYPADWAVSPDRSSKEVRQEGWLALENFYYDFKARSIGFSHYCSQHIDDILEIATVRPSINQVEYHVGSGDVDDVIDKCRSSNITFMSFSPLCGPCQAVPDDSLIDGELVTRIADKYTNISGSQIALRYIVQQALAVAKDTGNYPFLGGIIPRSNNMDHIISNRDIFSFELTEEDMMALGEVNRPSASRGDCDVL